MAGKKGDNMPCDAIVAKIESFDVSEEATAQKVEELRTVFLKNITNLSDYDSFLKFSDENKIKFLKHYMKEENGKNGACSR